MSYTVAVTRSGGGAVAVTRSDNGVKVVVAVGLGSLVSIAQAAADSAETDAAAAAASAVAASNSASAAASSATDAETAQTAAELAETHAETAETNAAASALAAAGSASSASTSAGTATTQAGIATTQAGLAAASAVAADASADAADASAIAAAASAASITLPLPVASGGTAATDAATARSNLTAAKSGANTDITSVYLDNTGLKIKDTNASHGLTIAVGSNITADRTLTFLTGDANRNLAINSNSTISGSSTGTNTGDQTITLTGDVTGTGTGTFAATIAADAVTNAKLADMAALTVKANATNGAANPTDVAAGTTGHVFRRSGTALAFGTLEAGAFATGPGIVTPAMLDNGSALSVLGVTGNAGAARADITAGSDGQVLRRSGTAVAFGTVATAGIADDAITYAKIQNVSATSRILGRKTALAGDTEECTLSEILDFIGSAARGDILYRGSSAWARLGAGTSGYLLQTGGAAGDPSWAAYPTIVSLEGLSLASGDILYATAADTLARLPKGTDGQGLALASGLPSWASRREVLTGARTYYVRTDGSDSNTGLANTSGGAFLTIQKAVDTAAALDISIYDVTIQVGAGTYTGGCTVSAPWVGSGTVSIVGDTTTPANVIWSVTSSYCVVCSNYGRIRVRGFEFRVATAGGHLFASTGGYIKVDGLVRFGTATSCIQVLADQYGFVEITSNYTISGGGAIHWQASGFGMVRALSLTITLSGTPAFSNVFANADDGVITCFSDTFSGSATGTRFTASNMGYINTNGGGASYLPGNASGSGSNPGASPYGRYV